MLPARLPLRPLAALCAIVAGLALAACGGDDDDGSGGGGGAGPQSGPIDLTVGQLFALTGDVAAFGKPLTDASDTAVDQLKKAAREAGVDLRLQTALADTGSTGESAVGAARKVLAEDATCITGPLLTVETVPVVRTVTRAQGVAVVSPTAGSAEDFGELAKQSGGLVWSTVTPDAVQAKFLAEVASDQLGGAEGKTLAVAGRDDPAVQTLVNAFVDAWKSIGGNVEGPLTLATGGNYDSEAQRLTGSSPDAYMIYDYPGTFGPVASAMLRTGKFSGRDLFTADALALEPIPKNIPKEALIGATITRPGAPTASPAAKAFEKVYPKRFSFDAQTFDATVACVLAAVAAGSNEAEAIAERIEDVVGPPGKQYDIATLADAMRALKSGEDIDYQGVSGPVDLDSETGVPRAGVYDVLAVTAQGRLKVERQQEVDASAAAGE